MKLNIKFLKENLLFILLTLFGIVFLIVISIFMPENSNILPSKDLENSGEENINSLVINEIMASNDSFIMAPDGGIYDWIEIYNGNNYDINLKNYSLSDRENKGKWAFPEVIIEAKSYLIVYLSGKQQTGLYANFKISSSGGESIFLKNPSGKIVDAADITSMNENEAIARDLNGNWFASSKPTPGHTNTLDGYNNYLNSLIEASNIKINEILPDNNGNFKNSYNNYAGYIEIVNEGNEKVNLKGYCVSDDLLKPLRFCLSEMYIEPNNTIVVYMGNYESNNNEIYSGFNLNKNMGIAILTNERGKIIDKIEYNNLPNGMGLVKENGKFYETSNISPGYSNDKTGRDLFAEEKLKVNNGLIINEIMNNNASYLPQNGNKYYDWIELKNNSNENINLNEYTLTTTDNSLEMYRLPEKILLPGEYYILMASGDSNLSNNSYKHTNFKLSDIESLYLVKNKTIVDSMFISNIPLGYSYGRGRNYGFYYGHPTPKSDNVSGADSVAYTPSFSIMPGVYNNINEINLEIKGNGTIYYTLDGSTPNLSSKVYNSPILIDKTTVVKAISYQNDKLVSQIVTGSYIINENHTLPVMSVSLNASDFNKMQRNPWNTEIEVTSYAELYEDGKNFSIPCGFRLFGGSTRGLDKKSFALKFKKQYGSSSLNYQVFENRDYSRFDTLVLRSGSQDSKNAFIRDILATSLVEDVTNIKVQAYKSVVLYINGKYWGVYNIREKIDEDFISNTYNVDGEKSNIVRIDNQISFGSLDNYQYIVNYLNTHDMNIKSNYEYIKTKINMDSFIDFWVAENWVSNNDIINTRFYSHPDVDSGRVNMVFYDLDYSLWNKKVDYFSFFVNPEGMSSLNVSTEMMRSLMRSEEFKKDFLERLSYQLKFVWDEERVLMRIDEIYNSLKPEMERNQVRWNMTMGHWEEEVQYLRDFAKERSDYVKSTAKRFFKLSDSEMKVYFGD